MNLSEFVSLLALDWDAVLALAGIMAAGIFAGVQMMKVLQVAKDAKAVAYVVFGIAGVEAVLVILGYFFPVFMPLGLFVYGTLLAAAVAVNGYKYAFKPIIGRLFPEAEVSTEDLAAPAKKGK